MANWLGTAAGAGEGLETMLARMRADEELKQRQQQITETERSHKADEANRNQDIIQRMLDRKVTQDSLTDYRKSQEQDRQVGLSNALVEQIPGGTRIAGNDPALSMIRLGGRGALLEPEGVTPQDAPEGIAAQNQAPILPLKGTLANAPAPAMTGFLKSATSTQQKTQAEQAETERNHRALEGQKNTPTLGSFEDYLKRTYGENPTPANIEEARRNYNPAPQSTDRTRIDNSYNLRHAEIEKVRVPLSQQADRLSRLSESVRQRTPQADSLIAPELLTAMAGGQGSGLRMNEAEISRIIGGRTNLESLKAALNKWQTDPSKGLSVTDAQRGQIQVLMEAISGRITKKMDLLDKANSDLIDANDVEKHRRIVSDMQKALSVLDNPATGSSATPNLSGLQMGQGRTFRSGPFQGQTWTIGPDGQPRQVK